jgi:hypothetical protein
VGEGEEEGGEEGGKEEEWSLAFSGLKVTEENGGNVRRTRELSRSNRQYPTMPPPPPLPRRRPPSSSSSPPPSSSSSPPPSALGAGASRTRLSVPPSRVFTPPQTEGEGEGEGGREGGREGGASRAEVKVRGETLEGGTRRSYGNLTCTLPSLLPSLPLSLPPSLSTPASLSAPPTVDGNSLPYPPGARYPPLPLPLPPFLPPPRPPARLPSLPSHSRGPA